MKTMNKLGLLGFILGCTILIAATIHEVIVLFGCGFIFLWAGGFVFICDWE